MGIGRAADGRRKSVDRGTIVTLCGSIGFGSIVTAAMIYPDDTMYGQVRAEMWRRLLRSI